MKYGIWHHSGQPAENAFALAQATKTLYGDKGNGKTIDQILDYVDARVEEHNKEGADSIFSPVPKAVEFLVGLLRSDMPMSASKRSDVMYEIIGHTGNDRKLGKDSDLDSFAILNQAVDAYFKPLPENAHPKEVARDQAEKKAFYKAIEHIASIPVSEKRGGVEDDVKNIIKLGKKLLPESNVKPVSNVKDAYATALNVAQAAHAAGAISTGKLSSILRDFDVTYNMPEEIKSRHFGILATANIVEAQNPTSTKGDVEAAMFTLKMLGSGADPVKQAEIVNEFAKSVTSPSQTEQMAQVHSLVGAMIGVDDVSFSQTGFSSTLIGQSLYVVFNNVHLDGINPAVYNGQLSTVQEATQRIQAANSNERTASQFSRALRDTVREGAFIANGVKEPFVKKGHERIITGQAAKLG